MAAGLRAMTSFPFPLEMAAMTKRAQIHPGRLAAGLSATTTRSGQEVLPTEEGITRATPTDRASSVGALAVWLGTPATPTDKATPPVVKATPPVVKATPPPPKATPPVVKVAAPVVKATPPPPKATPPVVKATPPPPKATPPVVKVAAPVVKASDPLAKATEHPPLPPELPDRTRPDRKSVV